MFSFGELAPHLDHPFRPNCYDNFAVKTFDRKFPPCSTDETRSSVPRKISNWLKLSVAGMDARTLCIKAPQLQSFTSTRNHRQSGRGRLRTPSSPGRQRGVCVTPPPNYLSLVDREDGTVIVYVEPIPFRSLRTTFHLVLCRQRRLTDLNFANIKAN